MRIATIVFALLSVTASASELAGLWTAKKTFGPDARGTLVVERGGGTYTADLAGRAVAMSAADGELTFTLPDGGGTFRGRVRGTDIVGHWLRFGTRVNGNGNSTPVSASPVVLKPDRPNRWRGTVDPLEDTFTFFLLLDAQPDGSLRALLRNPERDIGTQYGVERLTRDGNAVTLMGKRGGKELEVARGTYDAEAGVITLSFPTRGGSYDFVRDTAGGSAFYPRGKEPARYAYRAPLALDDGWPVGTLDAAEIDRATIEKFVQGILDAPMDSPDAPQVRGLIIARRGKLVVEEYFHGHGRDTLQNTRSASKSLSALVVGAAMQAGAPLTLSSPVYQVMNGGSFPADLEPQKRAMTLEHLLTMSAGFFCDDTNENAPGNENGMWEQSAEPDFYRYTMKVPLATPPGENSVYCSAIPNLALGMAGRAARENPMSLFDRLIGEPMKIRRYEWGLDHAGNPYGGGGMCLALRDFIKLGQLMLDRGTWQGKRIVSEDFATRAVSRLYQLRNLYYGYQWWGEEYPYKDRTVYAFSARGAGGQTVTVVPELELIVATFAGNFFSRKGMFAASTDPIPRILLPAVREAGDDRNAPVIEREYVSPYGASKDGSRVTPPPARR
ncbi:MAG TPA: serine hydrolase domain-containing protein [Thermoanaerobaculia bacterium]|nr:serine hydrolase domain-containing protein [Thermoanaerobaculia bacterium]